MDIANIPSLKLKQHLQIIVFSKRTLNFQPSIFRGELLVAREGRYLPTGREFPPNSSAPLRKETHRGRASFKVADAAGMTGDRPLWYLGAGNRGRKVGIDFHRYLMWSDGMKLRLILFDICITKCSLRVIFDRLYVDFWRWTKALTKILDQCTWPCSDLLEAYNHTISGYWFDCQRPCLTVVGVWLS